MFDAQDAIRRLGVLGARRAAGSANERTSVDAAAALIETVEGPRSRLYGSTIVTSLPHREPGERRDRWDRVIGETSFELTSSCGPDGAPLGVPFGAKARIILLNLVDAAIRSGSPTLTLEASMAAWLNVMGMPLGGMTYRHISTQARRIGAYRVAIGVSGARPMESRLRPIVMGLIMDPAVGMIPIERFFGRSMPIFPHRVVLDPDFFDHVCATRVDLDGHSLAQIDNNSWALDLYIWLRSILPGLDATMHTPWQRLYDGIAFGYSERRKIKAKLLETLSLVLAVYPDARIEVEAAGLVLHPISSCWKGGISVDLPRDAMAGGGGATGAPSI